MDFAVQEVVTGTPPAYVQVMHEGVVNNIAF